MQYNDSGGTIHKAGGKAEQPDQPEQPLQLRDLPLRHPGVWLAVALGGAAGALLRFAWSLPFQTLSLQFPLAVYSENVIGAFVLGWLLRVFQHRLGSHRLVRAFLGTGLIGSFTTFSAITVDMGYFYQEGYLMLVWLYPLISVLAGLAAAAAGWHLGRHTQPPDPFDPLFRPPGQTRPSGYSDRRTHPPDTQTRSTDYSDRRTHPPDTQYRRL